ncbi:hypothetical protein [Deinococcus sp.]|uniref:hypothetical protein n=1 Tax=Deinococcus sp. TaxID=47478 RepID=UPI0025C1C5B8|nr:hypothetical protein [Deinococcus sp.]
MTVLIALAWLGVLYALYRLLPPLFPYGLVLTLLALLNVLPVLGHLLTDLARMSIWAWVGVGVLLMGLFGFARPLFFGVALIMALHFTGGLLPFQALANEVNGLGHRTLTARFLCPVAVRQDTARVYRVTQVGTALSILILAGTDDAGTPALCGSTLEHFPVLTTFDVNPHQRLNFDKAGGIDQYIEHPELRQSHWDGHGNAGFIPSLRGTNFRFPLGIDAGYLSLPTGTFPAEQVQITLVR